MSPIPIKLSLYSQSLISFAVDIIAAVLLGFNLLLDVVFLAAVLKSCFTKFSLLSFAGLPPPCIAGIDDTLAESLPLVLRPYVDDTLTFGSGLGLWARIDTLEGVSTPSRVSPVSDSYNSTGRIGDDIVPTARIVGHHVLDLAVLSVCVVPTSKVYGDIQNQHVLSHSMTGGFSQFGSAVAA